MKHLRNFLFCLSLAATAHAATPSDSVNLALDRAMQIKNTGSAESAILEDGGDIQLLKQQASTPFKFHVGIFNDVEYQSNANLDGNSGKGAAVWLPGAEVGLDWDIAPKWSLQSTLGAEAGMYSDVEEQNYWGLSSKTSLKYSFGRNLPNLYAGPDFYRYQSFDTGDEISLGVAPKVGMGYGYMIEKSKTYLFSDVRYQRHFVSPSDGNNDQDRHTVRVILGVSQQVANGLFALAYYEYRYSDYDAFNREDSRNTVGGSLTWEATRNLSLRLNASFTDNDSTISAAEFQSLNAGMGSSLIWFF